MVSMLYLIEAQCGTAKLGCSTLPENRLSVISGLTPVPIRLIAKWPGELADEKAVHERFIEYRSHNEWFRIEGKFAEFVEEHRGQGLKAPIPEWELLYFSSLAEKRAIAGKRRSAAHRALWAQPGYKEARIEWLRQLREART